MVTPSGHRDTRPALVRRRAWRAPLLCVAVAVVLIAVQPSAVGALGAHSAPGQRVLGRAREAPVPAGRLQLRLRGGWFMGFGEGNGASSGAAGSTDAGANKGPELKTRHIVLPLPPLPQRPLLMQLNVRVIVNELAVTLGRPATLDDVPDGRIDELAITGYHLIYLLGLWKTGEFGLNKSKKLLAQDPCMAGFPEDAVGSSPFAITDYSVADDLGGDDALRRLTARIRARRMRVIVDFVPNHVAIDHPWVTAHPNFFVQSTKDEHRRDPAAYFTSAKGQVIAFGRGLLWEPWEDTAQLNYGEPKLRKAMVDILKKIADMVDGVRCDVAMLVEQELFNSTWGCRGPATTEFWPLAIQEAKTVNPKFLFIAESYWEREKALMQKGFDFCYDKVLYDRVVAGEAEACSDLLDIPRSYQDKCVRFLENHDEDRAAAMFPNSDQHMAAAVLTLTAPGLHFVHDGQEVGRKRRVSMHITRRLPVADDVADKTLKDRYGRLLLALKSAALSHGGWERCDVWEILEDGQHVPCKRVMSHFCWSPIKGGGPFTEVAIVVVNYSPSPVRARLVGKEDEPGTKELRHLLSGRDCMLSDRLSACTADIMGNTFCGVGVHLQLQPWGAHVFDVIEK